MFRLADTSTSLFTLLSRAMLIVVMLAAPVFALPTKQAAQSTIIEAPAPAAKGIGFVLLMSLQRR